MHVLGCARLIVSCERFTLVEFSGQDVHRFGHAYFVDQSKKAKQRIKRRTTIVFVMLSLIRSFNVEKNQQNQSSE